MKVLRELIALTVTVFVLGFAYVWMFVPEKKQEIQAWWYGIIIDCNQMHSDILNHQRCNKSDDCELVRRESIKAEKIEVLYGKYCGKL